MNAIINEEARREAIKEYFSFSEIELIRIALEEQLRQWKDLNQLYIFRETLKLYKSLFGEKKGR